MRIDLITIFPEIFLPFLRCSLVGRAVSEGLINVTLSDLRDYSDDPHRSVDDEPYGGGGGMVMAAPPWIAAVEAHSDGGAPWCVLLTPQGRRLDDEKVRELSARSHLMLLCGRYEGIDERVAQTVVDEEISIGDYVLAGGEAAAMVVIEAVSRYVPGVVGLPESVENDSFHHGLLDYPHYTRPREVGGRGVPEVLLSGDHRAIRKWRRDQALRATCEKRPDLLAGKPLLEAGPTSCKSDEE
jgi:tRNA (guanine37-N1)-methyltransferase